MEGYAWIRNVNLITHSKEGKHGNREPTLISLNILECIRRISLFPSSNRNLSVTRRLETSSHDLGYTVGKLKQVHLWPSVPICCEASNQGCETSRL